VVYLRRFFVPEDFVAAVEAAHSSPRAAIDTGSPLPITR